MSTKSQWKTIPLGTVAEFRNGINFTKKNFGQGIKVINVRDFQDYTAPHYEDLDEINPQGVVREADLLQENDIVFVRSNGNRNLIGRSLFIDNLPEPVTHSAFTIRTRFTSDKVLPRFYAYLFRSPLIRQVLTAYGGGTNISNLNQRILNKLEVPFPPLPTQRKIAAILSAYDDLIENNTRRIAILEEMAQAIYREWFVEFRFPGHEQVKLVESELGPVPEGWEVKRIADFGEVITGKTPSKKKPEYYNDDYMPFIKTPSMHGKVFVDEVEEYLSEAGANSQKKKTLPPNTPIVNCIGALSGSVSLTVTHSQTNQQINAVVLKDLKTREFLYFALVDLRETIRKHGSTGATMINLSKGKFESLQVACPDERTLAAYHQAACPMFDQIKNLQLRNITLRQTRDLLLPRLISGEVDVSAVEIAGENH